MYRALVTGASGFIGRHLVDRLIKEGFGVSVFVRDQKKTQAYWPGKVQIYQGDVTDKDSIALISKDIDVVFHLVAVNIHQAPRTAQENKYVYEVNVEGTRNVLEAFAASLKQLIFFSSTAVYDGNNCADRLDESVQAKPNNIYGETKLIAEGLVADYGKKYGFVATSLRYPFVYGPGNKGNIFKMIEAVDRQRFILIGRGDNVRNGIYVDNVIDAALSVVGKKIASGKSYIVTDDLDYTLKQIYMAMVKSLGRRPNTLSLPLWFAKICAKMGDVITRFFLKSFPFNSQVLAKIITPRLFSPAKIREEIGFVPKYNFFNTVDATTGWYKSTKMN